MKRCWSWSALLLLTGMILMTVKPLHAGDPLLFASSFKPGDAGAIQAYRLHLQTGTLHPLQRTTGVENPFFLALSPDRTILYSIHAKQFGGNEPEQIAAYQLSNPDGGLKLLNRQSTRGTASCSLAVDCTGRTVLVANYTSGDIASLPVLKDGSLQESASFIRHQGSSVNPARQKEPHAHCIVVSPDNRFVLAADLGTDQLLVYRLDEATSKLTPHDPPFVKSPAGAGPRHLVFHPNGERVYVINELSNSVSVYNWNADAGTLKEWQTISTLPPEFTGISHCADLKITPDGRFLYATNRGHDSLASYRIGDDGRLTLLKIESSLGKGPQNLLITPDGGLLLCANMPGNNIAVFRINSQTGALQSIGCPVELASPSCLMLVP